MGTEKTEGFTIGFVAIAHFYFVILGDKKNKWAID